jgi:glycosyltransferase involved in cell wall biosynthesis
METKNSHLDRKKNITIVSPTYNEEANIANLLDKLLLIRNNLVKNYDVDFLIIDNSSTDNTISILKSYAEKYKFIKLIINTRNFGHIRSPYYGIIQSYSDATIYLASDFEDPPDLIPEFISAWEQGFKVTLGIKTSTTEKSFFLKAARSIYYLLLKKISTSPQIEHSTGFGLYDKVILNQVRAIADPYPYLRGIISGLGYEAKKVFFQQIKRKNDKSKNNIFSLYDIALLGIINHSTVPLRICSFIGFFIGLLSFFTGIYYFIYKILYWDSFTLGFAPLLTITCFLSGLILFFIGVLGEYITVILRYQKRLPVVVEKERINFD